MLVMGFGLLVGVLVGLAILAEIVDSNYTDNLVEVFLSWVFGLFVLVFAVIVATLIGGGAAALIGNFAPTACNESSSTKLISLHDAAGINGSFFLGSGYIDSNLTVFYYYQDGSGIRSAHVNEDDVVIHQDNNAVPRIQHYEPALKGNWDLVALPVQSCADHIFVPENTILPGFSLGGQK